IKALNRILALYNRSRRRDIFGIFKWLVLGGLYFGCEYGVNFINNLQTSPEEYPYFYAAALGTWIFLCFASPHYLSNSCGYKFLGKLILGALNLLLVKCLLGMLGVGLGSAAEATTQRYKVTTTYSDGSKTSHTEFGGCLAGLIVLVIFGVVIYYFFMLLLGAMIVITPVIAMYGFCRNYIFFR
ncbi:MAG: hypothetical protein PHS41_11130, partial [Victivallaceae bacterium]|nr:hypothetical protein [Victivallaceae bacterium]